MAIRFEANAREWKRWSASLIGVAAVLVLVGGCSESGRATERLPQFIKAPPKPGSSISHTRMCECHACSPRDCCQGADETELGDPSCGGTDDYDFTRSESCGVTVRSCTTRCAREIWRVKAHEDCDVKRPSTCCG